jgi:hypothetical protein
MKIISGGQTGVDRAALDVALKLGLPHGGWCPKKRKAEDGPIPSFYFLRETESEDYSERTKKNIADSDGTLILVCGDINKVSDGTILTKNEVSSKNKPNLIFDLLGADNESVVINWIIENKIKILNIAGPRETQTPGIYKLSLSFLEKTFVQLKATVHAENDEISFRAKL